MKRPHQIESLRAVKQLEEMTADRTSNGEKEVLCFLLDVTPCQGLQVIAALGGGCDGTKRFWRSGKEPLRTPLSWELLGDLMNRGLAFTV